jgi:gamma-glutamyltranspeptidase/glutathione hydrolase
LLGGLWFPGCSFRRAARSGRAGAIIGEEAGAEIGMKVLAEGGNAVDAAVAAALTSCVATPARCGIGGYGGHLTLAFSRGGMVTAIDFNSTAPAATRPDMYPLDENGKVQGRVNFHGWRAVGVPGTLAGLQLALDRFGTKSFRELAQPAIELARKGFVVSSIFAGAVRNASARFLRDAGSAKLFLPNGRPPRAGELLANPDLAAMLATLAERNSVDSFYRGDIAARIAEGFAKNGGLVTALDLAAYQAREVKPLRLALDEFEVFTAPLTAGGLTVLEALSILKALEWDPRAAARSAAHAHLEALRLAWETRLNLLGDPEQVEVPVARLLSAAHAREAALKVEAAVRRGKPLEIPIENALEDGTNNLSCVDREGNVVALTLTQGGSFGAQVTVDGLGLTLGHGMSRFNPRPGHPNSPAPGKRPLHNMCPTVVLREGKPVLAIGGAGGVRIPNALYQVLTEYLFRRRSMEASVEAPRLHCTGTTEVLAESGHPDIEQLKQSGFDLKPGSVVAHVSAVSFDPSSGAAQGIFR